MLGEERRGEGGRPLGNQVNLGRLLSDDWCDGTQEVGHSCAFEEKNRKGGEVKFQRFLIASSYKLAYNLAI